MDESSEEILDMLGDALFWLFWPSTWRGWALYIILSATLVLARIEVAKRHKEEAQAEAHLQNDKKDLARAHLYE